MIILKYIILLGIFGGSFWIGILISKRYKNRVLELREFKEVINIIETKIRFTYEPLKEIFEEISKIPNKISNIFKDMSDNMQKNDVTTSWNMAIESSKAKLSLNDEDINIIKGLGKFLRQNRCRRSNK